MLSQIFFKATALSGAIAAGFVHMLVLDLLIPDLATSGLIVGDVSPRVVSTIAALLTVPHCISWFRAYVGCHAPERWLRGMSVGMGVYAVALLAATYVNEFTLNSKELDSSLFAAAVIEVGAAAFFFCLYTVGARLHRGRA